MSRIQVAHVITDMSVVGGAERMTAKLAERLPGAGVDIHVVSLVSKGELGAALEATGVPVTALGLRGPSGLPKAILSLARLLRLLNPDVVTTWLYHADLVGTLANAVSVRRPLIWNLRNSDLELGAVNLRTATVMSALTWLSRAPDLVLSNSRAGLLDHQRLGYRPRASAVIPNGFDTAAFRPDVPSRERVRRELGLGPKALTIGMAARVAPMKDHSGFLAAAKLAGSERPDLHFVLVGEGTDRDDRLALLARETGLGVRIHRLGARPDMPAIFNALDIASLSSATGEGFPNVIGEAMACGAPCVATNVGDVAEIVGDTGRVVPPRSPEALAEAWIALADMAPGQRRRLGMAARDRIVERYSLDVITGHFADAYRGLVGRT